MAKISITGTHNVNHSTFGGIIYPSDFNTNHAQKGSCMTSSIAKRIVGDWIFDRQCRVSEDNARDYRKTVKNDYSKNKKENK